MRGCFRVATGAGSGGRVDPPSVRTWEVGVAASGETRIRWWAGLSVWFDVALVAPSNTDVDASVTELAAALAAGTALPDCVVVDGWTALGNPAPVIEPKSLACKIDRTGVGLYAARGVGDGVSTVAGYRIELDAASGGLQRMRIVDGGDLVVAFDFAAGEASALGAALLARTGVGP